METVGIELVKKTGVKLRKSAEYRSYHPLKKGDVNTFRMLRPVFRAYCAAPGARSTGIQGYKIAEFKEEFLKRCGEL